MTCSLDKQVYIKKYNAKFKMRSLIEAQKAYAKAGLSFFLLSVFICYHKC
jgi:hypothetical protein